MDDRRSDARRAAPIVVAMLAVAAVIAALVLLLGIGERDSLDLSLDSVAASATADTSGADDPLAWDASKRSLYEQRATLGLSHVLYEKSPDGIVASAERTDAFRDQVEAAAKRHGIDADTLEAVILLESAGRPDAMAAPTPDGAVGLAQILPETATSLLDMKVDLGASTALTKAINKASRRNKDDLVTKLEARRQRIDERYDPEASIEGAASYLEFAEDRLGDAQLAIVSYHMGLGNLETVIADYTGKPVGEGTTAKLIDDEGLSYAQLFFDTAPGNHDKAWEMLSGLGDDSSTYLWRVLAARQAMNLYRSDPDKLDQLNELQTAKATLEEVFHPEGTTEIFEDGDAIADAVKRGDLAELPDDSSLGWKISPQMGELAPELDRSPETYRALRPEALAALTYIGAKVKAISGEEKPLAVTSSVRDLEYQDALIGVNGEATTEYSLHTTGYSFDIKRDYASDGQAAAFQFVLDRMRALGLLDYAYEPAAIHVTVSNNAKVLLAD